MKNCFATTKTRRISPVFSILLPIILFVVIFSLFLWGVSEIGETAQQEQLHAAENAVTRAVVLCYTLEGQYPPNIEYLRDHYGLSVDEDKYIIHYDVFASNLMPQIYVFPATDTPAIDA